jgi:hypothetical protein
MELEEEWVIYSSGRKEINVSSNSFNTRINTTESFSTRNEELRSFWGLGLRQKFAFSTFQPSLYSFYSILYDIRGLEKAELNWTKFFGLHYGLWWAYGLVGSWKTDWMYL